MSWMGPKLILNNQDVEEGQVPNCGNPQPNNVPIQHIDQGRKHYYNEERSKKINGETAPDHQLHHEESRQISTSRPPEIEYKTHQQQKQKKDDSYSPHKKKKTHKSEHKEKHRHRSSHHHKNQELQINRQYSKDKEKQTYLHQKKKEQSEKPHHHENHLKKDYNQEFYPPPPYYPPYLYPPPPPNMYPYQVPPHCMPSEPYNYRGMPMAPPMYLPPPHPEYPSQRHPENNEVVPAHPELDGCSQKKSKNERNKGENLNIEKYGEGDDKMFQMEGYYMYPYPPPPMGYPGYPPPGYMMYPPEPYYSGEQDEQLKSWRRRQLVDNQKQRARKALKHLSQELKIEMLDTFRIITKLQKKRGPVGNSQFSQTQDFRNRQQSSLQEISDKCYQKNVFKLDKWLRDDDSRIREAVKFLANALHMQDLQNRIREVRELRRVETEGLQSVARSLLDRLIVSRRQVVF